MKIIFRLFSILSVLLVSGFHINAQDALLKDSAWNFHFQFTGIIQYNPAFPSPYTGQNSFLPHTDPAFSVTTTAYFGRKLAI